MIEQLIKFFVVFFVVVEPISLIPLFAGLTQGASARYKKKMAGKSATIALAICVLFALVGARFLDVMGITLSSFRIAGGTLLFLIALDMVFARTSGTKSTTPEKEEAKTRDDTQEAREQQRLCVHLAGGQQNGGERARSRDERESQWEHRNILALFGLLLFGGRRARA